MLSSIKTRSAEVSPNTVNMMVESRHARHLYDGGFTLIELMITLLIMAVLLAIAIPTFLGATRAAVGHVAQANSNTALLDSQNTFYATSQTYQPASTMVTTLHRAEPDLPFQTTPSPHHSQVSLYVASELVGIIFAVQSNTKKDCWYTIINAKAEAATTVLPITPCLLPNWPSAPISGKQRSPSPESPRPAKHLPCSPPTPDPSRIRRASIRRCSYLRRLLPSTNECWFGGVVTI